MDRRPSIDRVREREQGGPAEYDTAREEFSEKQAELDRIASVEHPEAEGQGEFKERMAEKLKESGKDKGDDA